MQVKFSRSYSEINSSVFQGKAPAQRTSLADALERTTSEAFSLPPQASDAGAARVLEKYLETGTAAQDKTMQAKLPDADIMAQYSPPPTLEPNTLERMSDATSLGLDTIASERKDLTTPEIVSARRVTLTPAKEGNLKKYVTSLVGDAASRLELDSELGLAIIQTESSFRPTAVSKDGHASKGLFQLLDSTGKELASRHFPERTYNPFDPQLNVELGMRHLKHLFDVFSDDTKLTTSLKTTRAANASSKEKLAVAAFNAGEGRVAWAQMQAAKKGLDPGHFANIQNYLPASTQTYVQKVDRHRAGLKSL